MSSSSSTSFSQFPDQLNHSKITSFTSPNISVMKDLLFHHLHFKICRSEFSSQRTSFSQIFRPADPFKNSLIYFTEYFSYERPTISSSALQNLQIRILVIENLLTLPPSVPSLNISLFITSLCLYDNFLSFISNDCQDE